jgi:hypothetical protein
MQPEKLVFAYLRRKVEKTGFGSEIEFIGENGGGPGGPSPQGLVERA